MIVADASAVVEAIFRTPLGDICRERILGGDTICAPHLIDVEVVSVIRRFTLGGKVLESRANEALLDLYEFPVIRYPHLPFLQRAWEMRNVLTTYDAVYVALAEALDAPLVTCDIGISRAGGHSARIELMKKP